MGLIDLITRHELTPEELEREERREWLRKRSYLNAMHGTLNLMASFLIPLVTITALWLVLTIAFWISTIYVFYMVWYCWPTRKANQ